MMEDQLDPNAVLKKFQEKLSEANTTIIVLELKLEAASAELRSLKANHNPE